MKYVMYLALFQIMLFGMTGCTLFEDNGGPEIEEINVANYGWSIRGNNRRITMDIDVIASDEQGRDISYYWRADDEDVRLDDHRTESVRFRSPWVGRNDNMHHHRFWIRVEARAGDDKDEEAMEIVLGQYE